MNPLTPFLMLVLGFSAFLIGWLIVYEIKKARKPKGLE